MSQATASQQSRQTIVDVLGAESPQLWDAEAPLVFADDLAAIRGDGVFETMMLRDGVVHNMERHRARFLSSAAMLELDIPDMQRWAPSWRLHTFRTLWARQKPHCAGYTPEAGSLRVLLRAGSPLAQSAARSSGRAPKV